ncbi:FAD dependent oxidoreductase [Mycena crocata]|nr:FAD dependent oxidoreductase [Mycena crocata]
MRFATLVAALTLASSTFGLDICKAIQSRISSASAVFYPTDVQGNYTQDLLHWALSSTQSSLCTVEPGTAADVSIIIRLLGSTRTPFAVKGGGHAMNQGFSSTTGVHIAMSRFSRVKYDAASETAEIGSGLIWDDVYAALDPFGVNVVGGRASGIGVAGFTLGGGYSFKTNQFGLTVDTVTEFELVKPNGDVVCVTASAEPDLFFALKGGLNNFGIVTKFTLKTFPQGKVWGGYMLYGADQIPAVTAAVARFSSNVTDPKAALLPSYSSLEPFGTVVVNIMFYDGPTPPAGIFDEFLAIPTLVTDIDTRSFLELVQAPPASETTGRGAFHTVSVRELTPNLIDAILNETNFWASKLNPEGATFISTAIEPFLPSIYTHNTIPTAFPGSSAAFLPLNLYFAWTPATADATFQDAIRQSAAHITQVAIAEGQVLEKLPLYSNYALFDTPLTRLYGANLPRLQAIKKKVDPRDVMGLAGGFKF